MWISRTTFEALLTERTAAQAKAGLLEQQVAALNTGADWMRIRLTQLEHERAALIYRYMDVKMVVPEISQDAPAASTGAEALSDIPSFEDMGDDKAAEQGIDWDAQGRLTQHGKVIQ